ncbi:MAG: hypothetical protein JWN25_487, partial [Verrucomicrobiales bacterium]|nr:hypothetical protein [Verrucomicrobiales bacterium]
DGHPTDLESWITQDGLECLKVKLKGTDADWDLDRLLGVGNIAINNNVNWLSADFNCCVKEPDYVVRILEHLRRSYPRIYGMLLYVEQPFPYELQEHPIDVHAVSSMKPLYLDESAHDWKIVKRGYELGWNGVALKTCKTITSAVLSCCWARAHGMEIMVQDLTNPMLAQIAHVQLARAVGTIMGVESNAMQFYPDVSKEEERVHPGLYRRRNGKLDLRSLTGSGLQYRVDEIVRVLPAAARED